MEKTREVQQEFVWSNRRGTCFVVRFSWQRPNGTRNTACPELVEGQHEFGENHMKSERAARDWRAAIRNPQFKIRNPKSEMLSALLFELHDPGIRHQRDIQLTFLDDVRSSGA